MSTDKDASNLNTGFGFKGGNPNYGRITDESVEKLASRIGVERKRDFENWEL